MREIELRTKNDDVYACVQMLNEISLIMRFARVSVLYIEYKTITFYDVSYQMLDFFDRFIIFLKLTVDHSPSFVFKWLLTIIETVKQIVNGCFP